MQCCDFPSSCQQKQEFEFWLIIQVGEFQSSLWISRGTAITRIITETKQNHPKRRCKNLYKETLCISPANSPAPEVQPAVQYNPLVTFAATPPSVTALQGSKTRCEAGRSFTPHLFWWCLEVELFVNSELPLQKVKIKQQRTSSFLCGASLHICCVY